MAIGDYIYWLKAKSGDTTPSNEVGGAHTLAGGTISLLDDTGDYYWRFSGGPASATGPSFSISATTNGGGITIAGRLRINTYPTGSTTDFLSYSIDSTTAAGIGVGNNSTGWRGRYAGSVFVTGMATPGASFVDFVLKATMSSTAGSDNIHLWYSTSGNSGDSPDLSATPLNLANKDLTTIIVNSIQTSVLDVADWVIWGEELPDSVCASMRNNGVRTTIDTPPTTAAEFAAVLPTMAWSGSAFLNPQTPVEFAAVMPAMAWSGDVALSAPAGILTSNPFHNGAVMQLASGSIPNVLVCSLDLATTTRFTGQAYNASGVWSIQEYPIVAGTTYLVLYSDGSTLAGHEFLTAA